MGVSVSERVRVNECIVLNYTEALRATSQTYASGLLNYTPISGKSSMQ